jgi:hypothetical protein
MSIKQLILASVLSIVALAATLPAHVSAASQGALTASGHTSATQAAPDALRPTKTTSLSAKDNFPFRSCFTFFNFCNSFNSFVRFNNCFGFFSFGCNSFRSFNRVPFFPFFHRFNSIFNNSNCIRIMRMPNGGMITISVC